MDSSTRNADRVSRLLRACEVGSDARFPPTEIFNEGWMLRLLLDAIETRHIQHDRLAFEPAARWYSEARLGSAFRPRSRGDSLGEGFTNADGVVGHFDFHPTTRAGLTLRADASQFVVLEAKMFSNLSSGTRNAPSFNQAARNVACMARTIETSGRHLSNFKSLGFFILAPNPWKRRAGVSNLETYMDPATIERAVGDRIAAYASPWRAEVNELRSWYDQYFRPLLDLMVRTERLAVLSWDECIDAVAASEPDIGEDLRAFYARCLALGPVASDATLGEPQMMGTDSEENSGAVPPDINTLAVR